MPRKREPVELLRAAIRRSGLSDRQFAELVVTRDERTVRRWLAGDVEIPAVVLRALQRYLTDENHHSHD